VFSFFKRRPKQNFTPVTTDIHSHLLAGLDDGVQSLAAALEVIQVFGEMGYRKLVTTPHVMSDFYRNSASTILPGIRQLKEYIAGKTEMEVEAAAEYYLDEELIRSVELKERLLTFGKQYLLFETNFISEPLQLKEFIFKATSSGYKPVLAHPERYQYMTLEKAEDLKDRGVLFQLNSLSIGGYYSEPVQRMATKLIDQRWVDFLGSDCHTHAQIEILRQVQKARYYQKALALPLLNHSL
jgi:protein-tyrosine phosphatase